MIHALKGGLIILQRSIRALHQYNCVEIEQVLCLYICSHNTLQFHGLDRDILLPHAEELECGKLGLASLGVSIDLHAQEVALILPVELALQGVHGQRVGKPYTHHIRDGIAKAANARVSEAGAHADKH